MRFMKTICWLAAAFAVLTVSSAARAQNEPLGRKWAVVIGVSKYPRLPGGQQLQFADRDAISFASLLRQSGVPDANMKVLVGAQATLSAIKSAVGEWLARSSERNDTVYVYFSGHGFFEREFSEGYFLAYDSDLHSLYSSALSVGDLKVALGRRVRAAHVVVVADAVRKDFFDPDAGLASDSTGFFHSLEDLAFARPALSVLMASSPTQFSREGQRWGGMGVFTKLIGDAIANADRDHDGALNGDEVFDYVREKLAQETSAKQQPWRSGASMAQARLFTTNQVAHAPAPRMVEPAADASPPRPSPPTQAVAGDQPRTKPGAQSSGNVQTATREPDTKVGTGSAPNRDATQPAPTSAPSPNPAGAATSSRPTHPVEPPKSANLPASAKGPERTQPDVVSPISKPAQPDVVSPISKSPQPSGVSPISKSPQPSGVSTISKPAQPEVGSTSSKSPQPGGVSPSSKPAQPDTIAPAKIDKPDPPRIAAVSPDSAGATARTEGSEISVNTPAPPPKPLVRPPDQPALTTQPIDSKKDRKSTRLNSSH